MRPLPAPCQPIIPGASLLTATCPLLVGREAELGALACLLEETAAGHGNAVFLGGEAGIGKTRLCRQLRSAAAARQLRVIEGRCAATRSSVAYAPLLDAIRFRLARGEGGAAAGLLTPLLGHLAPVFPELGAGSDLPSPGGPVPQERAFQVIAEVIERLANLSPLLLLLEDIHWADATSLELIEFLTRRIITMPLLLVTTYCSDELRPQHPLRRLLAVLAQERLGHRVNLQSLSYDETAEMLRAMTGGEPDEELLTVLWRRTEGNPFFIEELIKAWPRNGAGSVEGNGKGVRASETVIVSELPFTIREAVNARVESLDGTAREVLSIAAVIGRRFSFDLLRTVSGLPEESLLKILEELLLRHLLVEEPSPDEERYSFRHALTQEVLYDAILVHRRRAWHARVAAALENAPAADRPLLYHETAHHYRMGGDPIRAARYALLAGDEASRLCAWAAAQVHYTDALNLLDKGRAELTKRAEILEKLARVAWWQSDRDQALRYIDEALAHRRKLGDAVRTASLLRQRAVLHAHHDGDVGAAIGYLEEAMQLLPPASREPELARVANDMAHLLLRRARPEAKVWLTCGLAFARGSGDRAEAAVGLAGLAHLAILGGQIGIGIKRLDQAWGLLQGTDFPPDRTAALHATAVRALYAAGQYRRAGKWLEAASAHPAEHGLLQLFALFQAYRAALAGHEGLSPEVVQLAAQGVEQLRRLHSNALGEALVLLGDLHRFRGQLGTALGCYEEALALGERGAAVGRALVLLADHQATKAAAAIDAVLPEIGSADELLVLRALPVLTEAQLESGQLIEAAQALERLETEVRRSDDAVSQAALRHVAGRFHAAAGRASEAEQALTDAAEAWHALGRPLDRARALFEIGAFLVADQRGTRRGVAMLKLALGELERLGADLDASRTRTLLRRYGLRVPATVARPVPSPDHGLTRRELEVLAQLVRGLTNKEIATVLGIAERTAGVHVSHILAKLRCSTRTQAAGHALTHGLVQLGAVIDVGR